MDNEAFLKKAFSWHYNRSSVNGPPEIASREFGIGAYGKKISNRHLSFSSKKALNEYLVKEAPLFISYSCAYYEKPSATPMSSKGFLGADLIYEYDADDFNDECASDHDSWVCKKCNASGRGNLKNCPDCGSAVSAEQWVCDKCLTKAKNHTLQLKKTLEKDFLITEGISINFSGAKGYHLHVRSDAVKGLSNSARVELVDYLTTNQISLAALGFYSEKRKFFCPKEKNAYGWSKKILEGVKDIFDRNNFTELAVAGATNVSTAKRILGEKKIVFDAIKTGFFPSVHSNSPKFWKSVVEHVIRNKALPIDRQTSVDIRKIVRVPNTLHGSTGLNASLLPEDKINGFDPLKDAIVFSDKPIKVKTTKIRSFSLNKKTFGPFDNEETELPMYAGIYLLARGSASLRSQ